MTHPVRVPRNAREIPAYTDTDAWKRFARYSTLGRARDISDTIDLFNERDQVWPWLEANGFRFYVPEDAPIYLTPDGRTAYLERFLIRTPSPWNRPQTAPAVVRPRDNYALTADRTDARRRLVGYPITRPLHVFAPMLATKIGVR